ncbi:hypothetical protein [Acinetobacter baumannii]|uniref:hypothetical protein n=1 Tax=Acinetobacter baumannii TaxID=470 RepID=UPI0021C78C89|nr:hypothetical protein [Acinetobacter baumannii]
MSDLETKAKENKSERDQELNDLRSILETEHGKRFLMRLINRSNYLQPTYGTGAHLMISHLWRDPRVWRLHHWRDYTVDSNAWLDMQRDHFKKTEQKVTMSEVSNYGNQQRYTCCNYNCY